MRALNFCMTDNVCTGLNAIVFNNSRKRLPSIGHNRQYYEGRVGEDRSGGPGKRRLVYLVQGRQNLLTQLFLKDISQPIITKLSARFKRDGLVSPKRPPAVVTSSSGGRDGDWQKVRWATRDLSGRVKELQHMICSAQRFGEEQYL